jgi:hypothetical protein
MKEQEFSFSSLIAPGAGSRQALERQLDLIIAEERKRDWPKSWLWRGPATYLKHYGTYFTGQRLPDEYEHLRGPMSRCHINALDACQQDHSLRYFTGVYQAGTIGTEHSWAVDPQGRVLEVTLAPWEPGQVVNTGIAEKNIRKPALPEDRYAYLGVEFDLQFVERWQEVVDWLPMLDLDPQPTPTLNGDFSMSPLMKHNYSKAGVPLP